MIFNSQTLLLLSLTSSAYGAPQMKYAGNTGPIAGVTHSRPSVQAPVGNLRGDSSLLGGNAKIPDVAKESADVKHPELTSRNRTEEAKARVLTAHAPLSMRG
ncbi:hypothetical protein NLG97_g4726 [Lecanicillium saksenae]|uniref:Uncharacterized protein n=1 Tax=Lecanicillium saksenae TaxID=468837 RepID=A0ACC1QUG7_9HYPO|nr:hypothetical protein NLG97_g4726 [Lecanicillium saksenae]